MTVSKSLEKVSTSYVSLVGGVTLYQTEWLKEGWQAGAGSPAPASVVAPVVSWVSLKAASPEGLMALAKLSLAGAAARAVRGPRPPESPNRRTRASIPAPIHTDLS